MPILNHEAVLQVHAAAVAISLGENRNALLAGIHPQFLATLLHAPASGGQLLSDLELLNRAEILTDGSVPLATWLENALSLAGSQSEAEVFRAAYALCPRGRRPSGGALLVSNKKDPAPIGQQLDPTTTPQKTDMTDRGLIVKVQLRLGQPLRTFDESALRRELTTLLGSPVIGIHITNIQEGSVLVTFEGNSDALAALLRALSTPTTKRDTFADNTGLLEVRWVVNDQECVLTIRSEAHRGSLITSPIGSTGRDVPRSLTRPTDAVQINSGAYSLLQDDEVVGKLLVTLGHQHGHVIEHWVFYATYRPPSPDNPTQDVTFQYQGAPVSLDTFLGTIPRESRYVRANMEELTLP